MLARVFLHAFIKLLRPDDFNTSLIKYFFNADLDFNMVRMDFMVSEMPSKRVYLRNRHSTKYTPRCRFLYTFSELVVH